MQRDPPYKCNGQCYQTKQKVKSSRFFLLSCPHFIRIFALSLSLPSLFPLSISISLHLFILRPQALRLAAATRSHSTSQCPAFLIASALSIVLLPGQSLKSTNKKFTKQTEWRRSVLRVANIQNFVVQDVVKAILLFLLLFLLYASNAL